MAPFPPCPHCDQCSLRWSQSPSSAHQGTKTQGFCWRTCVLIVVADPGPSPGLSHPGAVPVVRRDPSGGRGCVWSAQGAVQVFAEPAENTHTPPAEESPGQEDSATAIPSTKMNYPRGPLRHQVLGVVLYVRNFFETEFLFVSCFSWDILKRLMACTLHLCSGTLNVHQMSAVPSSRPVCFLLVCCSPNPNHKTVFLKGLLWRSLKTLLNCRGKGILN